MFLQNSTSPIKNEDKSARFLPQIELMKQTRTAQGRLVIDEEAFYNEAEYDDEYDDESEGNETEAQ